jgi:hypothetical protein
VCVYMSVCLCVILKRIKKLALIHNCGSKEPDPDI